MNEDSTALRRPKEIPSLQHVIHAKANRYQFGYRRCDLFSKAFDWAGRLPAMGIAARLFLWIHWQQAEAGSRVCLTDQSVADALGIDRRTVQAHKQLLIQRGYLAVEEAEEKRAFGLQNMRRENSGIGYYSTLRG